MEGVTQIMTDAAGKGLAGVVVADTRKSKVDGEQGRLYYGGYSIADLAANASFEEVVYLLWNDRLPNKAELQDLCLQINGEMAVHSQIYDAFDLIDKDAHPMGVLRTGVSMLGNFDPDADDNSPQANQRKSLRLLAKTTTLTAAWARIREGKRPIAPRDDLSLAGNFVYMMHGEDPDPAAVEAIETYLILLADHGFNASTFTARVVTSTDGDLYSAIVAAIGALKGPKHGGANEAAMRIFLEIGDVSNVETFFTEEVKGKGRRIMGMGHRVYKAPDPRGAVLKVQAEKLSAATGNAKWFDLATQLEDLALSDEYFVERKLYANVDYYSAIVLYTLDIPVDFFTPLFAVSRMAGWTAHVIEQWADNRLIRPKANYLGEIDLPWPPLESR
jgi:citrate synthase